MQSIIPKLILIDDEVKHLSLTQNICKKFPHIETKITTNSAAMIQEINRKSHSKTIGKTILHLAKSSGSLLKDCPGTNHYLCCGYKVLNSIENCSMECTYCILQHYLTNPVIEIHPQLDKMFTEIDALLTSDPKRLFRIGSGELSDSLLYDDLTNFSTEMIHFLRNYPNVLFEFKTKTNRIENLLKIDFKPKNILVGWSLNTPRIIKSEENKTTTLIERLTAAEKCQEKGYKLTFHFDPMIIYEGYIAEYLQVVDEIFKRISPKNIAWISLGMLRYPVPLRETIRQRFPKTKIIYGETIQGNDGKIRYFKKHRRQGFQQIYQQIEKYTKGSVFVYFCMESQEMWQEVMGFTPRDNDEFIAMFNRQLIKKYELACEY